MISNAEDHQPSLGVEVTFLTGQRPNGQFDEPSDLLLADKAEFETSRIRRWFARDWTSY
jgi:sulfide:quinone oxidoreductase